MRYLADITQTQAKKIQKLIENGNYESVAQFFSVAIENQIFLEESDSDSIIGDGLRIEVNSVENKESKNEPSKLEKLHLINIQSNPKTVHKPKFEQLVLSNGVEKEENIWLWGQINKIFPIKIGVRILLRELQNKQWIELDQFINESAKEAASVGNLIREYENIKHKKRNDKISAGLPISDGDKSQTRYKSHFLTYKRKDGLLNGAMALLKFANIKEDETRGQQFIGLTLPGMDFALINNPVLDEGNFEQSLNSNEAKFYLSHIEQHVKSEYSAIQCLLNIIKDGINERESLNNELKNKFGDIWQSSDAVINTQRAGLMARMHELGLLKKKRNGIYVTYHLSEFGKSYLIKS